MPITSITPATSAGNAPGAEPVSRTLPARNAEGTTQAPPVEVVETQQAETKLSDSQRYVEALRGIGKIRGREVRLQQEKAALETQRASLGKLTKADTFLKEGKIDEALAELGIPYDEIVKRKLAAAGKPEEQVAALKEEIDSVRKEMEDRDRKAQQTQAQRDQQQQLADIQEWSRETVTGLYKESEKYPHLAAFEGGARVVEEIAKMVKADPALDPTPEVVAQVAAKVDAEFKAILPAQVKRLLAFGPVRAAVLAELRMKAEATAPAARPPVKTITNGLSSGGAPSTEPTFKDIVARVEKRLQSIKT